jgi:formylglycine-generating enzyme
VLRWHRMQRWLPWVFVLALAGCVLPAWPPPWLEDDDTGGPTGGDDDTGDDDAGDDDTTVADVTWVAIAGGLFDMGSEEGDPDEIPVHSVSIPTFEMLQTEVTVAQYTRCVDAQACTEPTDINGCDWPDEGHEAEPMGCVTWQQALDFCDWQGGYLPSEAQWEFAARSEGQDNTYPWGDEVATCEYAIMHDPAYGTTGCDLGSFWVVCSRSPGGDTEQGLCDMAGNAWEWVQDWYHVSYEGAPSDGTAWDTAVGSARVVRGGSCGNEAPNLRAANRDYADPDSPIRGLGFRCVR